MTQLEATRLNQLERVVERGLATFIEVGQALLEIREGRLYKEYGTWDIYCRERWGFSANYAGRQIRASVMALKQESVPTGTVSSLEPIKTERQARRIAQSRRASNQRPAQYLPDILSEDSPRNLRTQVVAWCELGRHIENLLNDKTKLQAKSPEDLALIRKEVAEMATIAKRIGREVK